MKMGHTAGTTICSKHDAILLIARDIIELAEKIEEKADDALTDGQCMEKAIEERNKTIERLTQQINELEEERDEYYNKIIELEFVVSNLAA